MHFLIQTNAAAGVTELSRSPQGVSDDSQVLSVKLIEEESRRGGVALRADWLVKSKKGEKKKHTTNKYKAINKRLDKAPEPFLVIADLWPSCWMWIFSNFAEDWPTLPSGM